MQSNLSLFIRRLRLLFLALLLAGTALAARADDPPPCAVSHPPAQCNPTQCNPADDLPPEVDPWEDDLPGKRGPTGESGILTRLLDAALRLAHLGLSAPLPEASFRSITQP